jgi:ribonuclease HII
MKNAETIDPTQSESILRVPLFSNLKINSICLDYEMQAYGSGYRFVAGVDEVGRGCLAGPVVAAACILDRRVPIPKGLNDSKQLTRLQRDAIGAELRENSIAFAVGEVSADEIDRINILQATKAAMLLAIEGLAPAADFLIIDAVELRESPLPRRSIIKGDTVSASIAAASVIAKTYRDALMENYDDEFPQYGFSHNVGYGTAEHINALRTHGPSRLHRRTFRGVL